MVRILSSKNLTKMDSIAVWGTDEVILKKAGIIPILDKYIFLDMPSGFVSSVSSYMDKEPDSLANFLSTLFELSGEKLKAAEIDTCYPSGPQEYDYTSTLRFSSSSLSRVQSSMAVLLALVSKGDILVDRRFLKREKIPYELKFRDLEDISVESKIEESTVAEDEYEPVRLLSGGLMVQRHQILSFMEQERRALCGIYKEIDGAREYGIELPLSEYTHKEVYKKILRVEPDLNDILSADERKSLEKIERYDAIGVISHLLNTTGVKIQNVFMDGVVGSSESRIDSKIFGFQSGKTRLKIEKDGKVRTLELPLDIGSGVGMANQEVLYLRGRGERKRLPRTDII